MQRVKRRVLQALLVPLLLIGSVVAVQSPAQAVCAVEGRHIAFLGYNVPDYTRNCSGLHDGLGWPFEGFRARYWSGWFSYSCPPDTPLGCTGGGVHEFCDWDYVQWPEHRVYDPISGTYIYLQVHFSLDELYLNATKPARCQ
jgi:hypothetical protein